MENVIERLRASKKEYDLKPLRILAVEENCEDLYDRGYLAGQEWARTTASFEELWNLNDFRRKIFGRDQAWDYKNADSDEIVAIVWGYQTSEVASMREDRGAPAIQRFWTDVFGIRDEEDIHFEELHGFIDGAVGVYCDVADVI
jgi:hypothetical protein